jgi:predicted NAD/FAD-dependent oxidoreductase
MTVAVIGAGLAGLTLATALRTAGHDVTLFDKGRKPGGRLATRRADGFNHGCQFFTRRDPRFSAQTDRLGATAWPAAGPDRYVFAPDMVSGAETVGAAPILSTQVTALAREAGVWHLTFADAAPATFETVILAIPAPQAAALAPAFAPRLAGIVMDPCWAVMLHTPASGPAVLEPDQNPISWAALETARPGAAGPPRYTVHAAAAWSAAHLEESAGTVIAALSAAFTALTGLPVTSAIAHRWRYAKTSTPLNEPYLYDSANRLALCGDWCLAGRLEAAFLSATELGIRLLHDL